MNIDNMLKKIIGKDIRSKNVIITPITQSLQQKRTVGVLMPVASVLGATSVGVSKRIIPGLVEG